MKTGTSHKRLHASASRHRCDDFCFTLIDNAFFLVCATLALQVHRGGQARAGPAYRKPFPDTPNRVSNSCPVSFPCFVPGQKRVWMPYVGLYFELVTSWIYEYLEGCIMPEGVNWGSVQICAFFALRSQPFTAPLSDWNHFSFKLKLESEGLKKKSMTVTCKFWASGSK